MSCRQSFSMAPRESPSCKDKGRMPGQASAALPSHPQDAPTPERLPARCRQAIRDYAKNCIGRGKKKPHRSLRCCKAGAFHQRPPRLAHPWTLLLENERRGAQVPVKGDEVLSWVLCWGSGDPRGRVVSSQFVQQQHRYHLTLHNSFQH